MFVGILLLAFGVLLLMKEMGIIYGNIWDYIWPIALIALGLDFIVSERRCKK